MACACAAARAQGRARVVRGAGRPRHRHMPRHNTDWKSNSGGPWVHMMYTYVRTYTAGRYRHVRSHIEGGVLVDAHANVGWRAVILKARAHRFWPGGGAGTGPAIPAGAC